MKETKQLEIRQHSPTEECRGKTNKDSKREEASKEHPPTEKSIVRNKL